ncbi:hypothetical protein Goklo_016193 [Gossypium klotzschianum]|uniref:Uncharacterized protein n=1 Tax=Gossypium klotzschianum TaxID=34286 RepID=A0A7J8UDB8_9ROSI|nr:hypothetical protein [Gossypium klotzschianum]
MGYEEPGPTLKDFMKDLLGDGRPILASSGSFKSNAKPTKDIEMAGIYRIKLCLLGEEKIAPLENWLLKMGHGIWICFESGYQIRSSNAFAYRQLSGGSWNLRDGVEVSRTAKGSFVSLTGIYRKASYASRMSKAGDRGGKADLIKRCGVAMLLWHNGVAYLEKPESSHISRKLVERISITREGNWVCLNTDDAMKIDSGLATAGGRIRDQHGGWILGYNRNLGRFSVFNAEL